MDRPQQTVSVCRSMRKWSLTMCVCVTVAQKRTPRPALPWSPVVHPRLEQNHGYNRRWTFVSEGLFKIIFMLFCESLWSVIFMEWVSGNPPISGFFESTLVLMNYYFSTRNTVVLNFHVSFYLPERFTNARRQLTVPDYFCCNLFTCGTNIFSWLHTPVKAVRQSFSKPLQIFATEV